MSETIDPADFEFLRRAGLRLGLFVQRHLNYDPALGGGEVYIQERIKRGAGDEAPKCYIKYSTMREAWDFVLKFEQAFPERFNPWARVDQGMRGNEQAKIERS